MSRQPKPRRAACLSGDDEGPSGTVPLLLLDVDGVLNAFGAQYAEDLGWSDWRTGYATADGRSWPIVFAPEPIARLREWHEQGAVELQWLTTWGHDANGDLRRLVGLPELQVAGTYDEPGDLPAGQAAATFPVASHAAVSPSAPDVGAGDWWKHGVVQRLLVTCADRRLIWVDDELQSDSPYVEWARERGVAVVGPDPSRGLQPADLEIIAVALTL